MRHKWRHKARFAMKTSLKARSTEAYVANQQG